MYTYFFIEVPRRDYIRRSYWIDAQHNLEVGDVVVYTDAGGLTNLARVVELFGNEPNRGPQQRRAGLMYKRSYYERFIHVPETKKYENEDNWV